MARGGKKEASAAADPEVEERLRLKKLAFSKSILSQSQVTASCHSAPLGPSKTVIKHHGKDILRKSQRKSKYLFSFPGLLGPVSGGKIGDLKDLGTKNPILYLDFPQGQMKLLGTIVYPKNRYLTLQFSRGGKNVTCDEYFDNVIVFSDAWWIGTKEENPEELRLQFPNDLNVKNHAEYDFKGGVGVACNGMQASGKSAVKCLGQDSPKVDMEDDDSPSDYNDLATVTPARQSSRTAGKIFNFAEASSMDDLTGNGDETPAEEDDIFNRISRRDFKSIETESSSPVVFEIDDEDNGRQNPASEQCKKTAHAEDLSAIDRKSLVQTTLSSLFRRAEEKAINNNHTFPVIHHTPASNLTKGRKKVEERESGTVSKEPKKQHKKVELVNPVDQVKSKANTSGASSSKRKRADLVSTSQSSDPNDSTQVEDDDIEEFSSESQDTCESDEDWTAC